MRLLCGSGVAVRRRISRGWRILLPKKRRNVHGGYAGMGWALGGDGGCGTVASHAGYGMVWGDGGGAGGWTGWALNASAVIGDVRSCGEGGWRGDCC